MPRTSKAYQVGTWFRVDLGKGQWVAEWFGKWATGVVTHASGRGVLVAYFFGPFDRAPTLEEAARARPERGLPLLVGDTALNSGAWVRMGPSPGWREDAWSSPSYASMASGGRLMVTSFERDGTEKKVLVDGARGLGFQPYVVHGADVVPVTLREAFERRSRSADDDE